MFMSLLFRPTHPKDVIQSLKRVFTESEGVSLSVLSDPGVPGKGARVENQMSQHASNKLIFLRPIQADGR